jgi:hypothetical protein
VSESMRIRSRSSAYRLAFSILRINPESIFFSILLSI